MQSVDRKRTTWSTGRPLTLAVLAFVALVCGLIVWSSKVQIAGAVIGRGVIETSSTMTTVQHPTGGVVEEILAENGDRVQAGDLLVRLDSRQLTSDLTVVEVELFEVLANMTRLQAIINDTQDMDLPPLLAEVAATRPEVEFIVDRQAKQLQAYFDTIQAGLQLLDEQIVQVQAEIKGVKAQLAAKEDEQAFISQELKNAQDLAARKLIKISELFRLQRSDVSVRGDIGRFTAKVAELRGKISELTLKRLALKPAAHEKAREDLSKLRPLRTRYHEKRRSLLQDLERLDIRAPVDGKIHASRAQGRRSVVEAAKPLMLIVPDGDPVRIGVRIVAADIDQVFLGQEATLKFKVFGGRSVPIILGQVSRISADVVADPVTKKHYYDVKVQLLEEEVKKLEGRALLPGMPIEAYLSTNSHTPLNYVMRPIRSYFDRAFRDT